MAGFKSYIIDCRSEVAIKFETARVIPELREKKYLSCLIPYNGQEILNYYDVFLIVKDLQIQNIYLVTMRGALVKIDDIHNICSQIETYLSVRSEYKMLNDKYDRKNCL